jgi:hypothetical protein
MKQQRNHFYNFPIALRGLRQFVVWKLEERNGQTTKVPYNAKTGRKASSTNSNTWAGFEEAVSAYKNGGFSGIGFVFASDYCGIDLDKCRNPHTGEIEQWALDIIEKLDSYTEVSPSGTGLHIFVKARLPKTGTRKGRIEVYDSGRYFTLTGLHFASSPICINDRQEEVSALYEAIKDTQTAKTKKSRAEEGSCPAVQMLTVDDSALVKACGDRYGSKFDRLYSGTSSDYGNDVSRADNAFVIMLCGHTGDDSQVERIWKASGRYRRKLERGDYVRRTIDAARSWLTTHSDEEALDISDLEETEGDDLPISDDPQREKYLRQVARNASLVARCYMIFLRRLGFEKNCLRLLTALTAVSKGRLNTFIATRKWMLKYYQQHHGSSSQSTLQRDIKNLLQEQRKLGVGLISYKPGKKYFDNGQEIRLGSKFQLHLLRYSLQAISHALDIKAKNQRLDEVLDIAVEKIIADANFQIPQQEIKAKKSAKQKTDVKDLEQKMSDLQGEWIEQIIAENWADSQIWEEFQKLQSEFSIRLSERLSGSLVARNSRTLYRSQNEPYRGKDFEEPGLYQSNENRTLYRGQNEPYREDEFDEPYIQ